MLNKFNELNKRENINEDYIYLIEPVDSNSGFYLHQKKIVFISRQSHDEKKEINDVSTDHLRLVMGVSIKAIQGDPYFKEGLFNMLYYDGDYSIEEIDVFQSLCRLYIENQETMSFSEFFHLIRNLFNKTKEIEKIEGLGLFGELSIIYRAFTKYGVDLSKYWHKNGIYSKYDFIIGDLAYEIKTSTSSNYEYKIKHDQIFGSERIFIGTVSIQNNENGITIRQLVSNIKEIPDFYNNIKFMINLEKSLLNIKRSEENSYYVDEVRVYDSHEIKTIDILSDGVTNISYNYNFSNQNYITEEKFIDEVLRTKLI
ncbi:MAG: PD-(D/E)XK motif protein [Bacilli bacterium]